MIGHELARFRVTHAYGRVIGSQQKSSQKKIHDEHSQGKVVGDPVVPKQHKEYRKKDLQSILVEGPIVNIIDVLGWTNVGSLLGQLNSDKTNGGEDDFANMSPLEFYNRGW